jgi:hypothetical protein
MSLCRGFWNEMNLYRAQWFVILLRPKSQPSFFSTEEKAEKCQSVGPTKILLNNVKVLRADVKSVLKSDIKILKNDKKSENFQIRRKNRKEYKTLGCPKLIFIELLPWKTNFIYFYLLLPLHSRSASWENQLF